MQGGDALDLQGQLDKATQKQLFAEACRKAKEKAVK
jgi:hypothetical protein